MNLATLLELLYTQVTHDNREIKIHVYHKRLTSDPS